MPLKPLIVKKGIIQPSFGKIFSNSIHKKFFKAGVLTSTGVPVAKSKTIIFERDILIPFRIDPRQTEIKYIDEDVIYFANPQNHFGHILVGTMAYAHILLNNDYKKHKIVFIDEAPAESVKVLLGHLGVESGNIITIKEYTQFKSVVVVKQSLRTVYLPPRFIPRFLKFKVMFAIEREFIDTFRAISKNVLSISEAGKHFPNKLYFSRSKLEGKTILREDKIEQVFKKNGYEIFYPEQLSLDEQIKLVSNADFYACVQGTLEHHSLFMKDGATLIVMSRKGVPTGRQLLINKLQKTIRHIKLQTNIRPFGDKCTPNIIGATKDLIKFFDKNNFVYDADDLKPTCKDLKNYIDRCFIDNNPRVMKYIFKNLVKYHKSFWKQIK